MLCGIVGLNNIYIDFMEVINEIFYPVFEYLGYPDLEEHPNLKGFYDKLSKDVMPADMRNVMKDITKPFVYSLRDDKGFDDLPIFTIRKEDISSWGDRGIFMVDQLTPLSWTAMFYNKTPEIISKKLWDDAFSFKGDFNEWVKEKAKSFHTSGIIIRPEEKVCELYAIFYKDGDYNYMSISLYGKHINHYHINCDGCISTALQMSEEIKLIALNRNVSYKAAFFQEDMYNLHKLLYFKEASGIRPKLVTKGNTINYGGEAYAIQTEKPCIAYELIKN